MTGSIVSVLAEVTLPVVGVAGVGGLAGRRLGLQTETLQKAAFYIFSPALVFNGLVQLELSGSVVGGLIVCSLIVFALNAMVAFGWARMRHLESASVGSVVVASAVPNQGNMGLPMALLAFGSSGLEIATMLLLIGTVLSASAAVALGELALGEANPRRALLAPLRYPTIYAAAFGTLFNSLDLEVPKAGNEILNTLAPAAIPLMLVVLGMTCHVPRRADLHDPCSSQ